MTVYFDDVEFDGEKQDFSKDPGWLGSGNRTNFKDSNQSGTHDYGFSPQTSYANGSLGELGGIFWRSGDYSYYADRVGPLTFSDRLEASGKVVLLTAPPDSGMYLGWFNSSDRTNAPTQMGNFVGIKIGGPTHSGYYFVPAYATAGAAENKKKPSREHRKRVGIEQKEGPLLVPQKVFDWKLVYDPAGNGGRGTVEATLGSESVKLPLKDGDKAKGANFDRFGVFTGHLGGSFVKIYFDDLKYTATADK